MAKWPTQSKLYICLWIICFPMHYSPFSCHDPGTCRKIYWYDTSPLCLRPSSAAAVVVTPALCYSPNMMKGNRRNVFVVTSEINTPKWTLRNHTPPHHQSCPCDSPLLQIVSIYELPLIMAKVIECHFHNFIILYDSTLTDWKERSTCWPWRGKWPCCELCIERAPWQKMAVTSRTQGQLPAKATTLKKKKWRWILPPNLKEIGNRTT